jgi:hypothetical protein
MVMTTETLVLDPKLIPPHILAKVLKEIDSNREFDMGGYSVPSTVALDQFTMFPESLN